MTTLAYIEGKRRRWDFEKDFSLKIAIPLWCLAIATICKWTWREWCVKGTWVRVKGFDLSFLYLQVIGGVLYVWRESGIESSPRKCRYVLALTDVTMCLPIFATSFPFFTLILLCYYTNYLFLVLLLELIFI